MELLHLLCLPQSTNPNRTHRTSEFDTCPRHHETPPLTTFRAPPNLPVTGSRRPKPQPTRVPAMAHRAPRRATSVEEVVPFRSSKLTFLLRDSLAGNSRSRMAPWATRDGGTEGRRRFFFGGGVDSRHHRRFGRRVPCTDGICWSSCVAFGLGNLVFRSIYTF